MKYIEAQYIILQHEVKMAGNLWEQQPYKITSAFVALKLYSTWRRVLSVNNIHEPMQSLYC